jgi:hypothetical protein
MGLKRELGGRNIMNSSFLKVVERRKEEGKIYITKKLFDSFEWFKRINKYKQLAEINILL